MLHISSTFHFKDKVFFANKGSDSKTIKIRPEDIIEMYPINKESRFIGLRGLSPSQYVAGTNLKE